MAREVLLGFSAGLDNRGVFARPQSSPSSALGREAESFEVSDGALCARKADLPLVPACYIQGDGPYLVKFYGQQVAPHQVLESEGQLVASVGPFLCGALINSEGGPLPADRFHIYPIHRRQPGSGGWLSKPAMESVARVGKGIYLVPSSPDTTKEADLPLRWDGYWYACNAVRVTSGQLYNHFNAQNLSVWRANPLHSFTRYEPLVPNMTTFYGRRKTTTTPMEVDWLVETGRAPVKLRAVWRPDPQDPYGPVYIITDKINPPADSGTNGDYNALGFSDCSPAGLPDYSMLAPGGGYQFSLSLSSGGSWGANTTVEYCWTFAHTDRGIEGLPSKVVSINTGSQGSQKITVSLDVSPLERPPGTDRIRLWRRSRPAGGQWTDWQLIHTHNLLVTETPTYDGQTGPIVKEKPWFTVEDNSLPSLGVMPVDAFFRNPPPYLSRLVAFNGRLFGSGTGAQGNVLFFSTIGEPEYWPRDAAGILGYVSDTKWLGGYLTVGGPTQITAMVPESGAYNTTGTTGDNLLVFKVQEAYRLFGLNWSDFNLQFAFSTGCPYPYTLHNCGGYMVWRSRDHVVGLPAGGTTPEILSLSLWPLGRKEPEGGESALEPVAAYGQGRYTIKDLGDRVYDLDLTTRTWTPGRGDIAWVTSLPSGFGIYALPGSVLQIHTGRIGDTPPAYTYSASLRGEKAEVQVMRFNTPPVPSPTGADTLPRKKRLRRLWVCYASDPGPLALTARVAGAEHASPVIVEKTLPATSAGVRAIGQVVPIELPQPVVSHGFQLSFDVGPGSPSPEYAKIFWVALDYEELLTKV